MLRTIGVLLVLVHGAFASGWKASGPFGGSAKAIVMDPRNPRVLLVGSSNSLIYRSDNAGETWTLLPFHRNFMGNVLALAVDPGDSSHYFAGLEAAGSPLAGLYESTDSGMSWHAAPDLAGMTVGALAFWKQDSRRIAAGTRRGVRLSLDGGKTWSRISPENNPELQAITSLAIDPKDPDVIYAGTTHLPWKTVDGGKTWKSIHVGMLDDSDIFSIEVDPEKTQRVLISACSGIYRSENGGAAWKKFAGIPATHRRTHILARDPEKANLLYAGTTLGLFKSENGGLNWRQVNRLHVMSLVIHPRDPKTVYFATEQAGIWKSEDRCETASPLNQGFVNRKVTNLVAAGRQLYLTSLTDGGRPSVFQSGDLGASWTGYTEFKELSTDGRLQLFGTPLSDKLLFASSEKDRKFWRSVDGGKIWSAIDLPVPKAAPPRPVRRPAPAQPATVRTAAVRAFAVETIGTPPVLLAGTDRGLYRSKDQGVNWELLRIAGSVLPVQAIHAAPGGSGRLVIRTFYSMYLSEDSGASWKMMQLPVSIPSIYDIAISPMAGGSLLLACPHGLYISRDGARGWSLSEIGLPNSTVSSVRFHPGELNTAYAVQFGRIFRSGDGGGKWEPISSLEAEKWSSRSVWFAPHAPNRLFAVTSDNGILYFDLAGT